MFSNMEHHKQESEAEKKRHADVQESVEDCQTREKYINDLCDNGIVVSVLA
jgi:hypothetical protein